MELRGLLLLPLFLAATLAAPARRQQCDQLCIVPSGYEETKTYLYSYESTSKMYMEMETEGVSSVTLGCMVELEVLSACELVIKLKDVQLSEIDENGNTITSPNEAEFRDALQERQLRFGMQDGKITNVCPEVDEPKWVRNIKRGVLSALQVTKTSSIETDVTGKCPTEVYSMHSTFYKTKDYTGCSERVELEGSLQAIKLLPTAPTTTMLASRQSCNYTMDGSTLQSSQCEEVHRLKPYSSHELGPTAMVTQMLQFQQRKDLVSSSLDDAFDIVSDLLFEHDSHMMQEREDFAIGIAIVQDICASFTGGVDAETAHLFTVLVHEMRKMNSELITRLLGEINNNLECEGYKEAVQNVVIDALYSCGDTGCFQVMLDLMTQNVIENEQTKTNWLASAALIPSPTKEMIKAMFDFTSNDKTNKLAFVALSSMVNRYCTAVNTDCTAVSEVTNVIAFFKENLGARCRYRDDEEKKVIMSALRALANAAIPTSTVNPFLRKCYENRVTSNGIRIAAVQAAAAVPCEYQDHQELLQVFENADLDSEMRLMAYLGVMKCATQTTLDSVNAVLAQEETNQVGSFVVSHLKNLKKTNDPLKQSLRTLVENNEVTQTFLDDPLKFSRNFEISWYNDTTGLGFTGDSNIIFSPKSFLPRQVSVGTQFDVFGYAIEGLEIGGRVEGIQQMLESMLSPLVNSGPVTAPEEESVEVEDTINKRKLKPKKHGRRLGKKEKDASNEVQTRKKRHLIKESKLENVLDNFEVDVEDKPEGYLYMKLFGHDFWYKDIDDIKAGMKTQDTLEMIMKLAEGQTYEDTKSMMGLEHSISVPMGNGLPLRLTANASSTYHVKASGRLNLMGAFIKPRSFEIDGVIEPSVASEVSALLEIDAHCARAGLNHVARSHSAFSLGGKIIVENGRSVHLQMRAPEVRQDLVSFSSKVYFLHQESKDELPRFSAALEKQEISECTGDFIQNLLGVRVCGVSSYHEYTDDRTYPMGGSYQSAIYFEKAEDDLMTYDLEASYSLDSEMVSGERQDTDNFHLMIGTPNTAYKRTYDLQMSFNRQSKDLSVELETPFKTFGVNAGGQKTDGSAMGSITFTMDEEEFSLSYDYERSESGGEVSYYPGFDIVTPHLGELHYSGSIIHNQEDESVSIDMQLLGQTITMLTVGGTISKVSSQRKTHYGVELNFGGDYLTASADVQIQRRDSTYIIDTVLTKPLENDDPRTLTLQFRLSDKSSEEGAEFDVLMNGEFSHMTQANFRFDSEFTQSEGLSSSNTKFCYGSTSCSGDDKIVLSHDLSYSGGEHPSNTLTLNFRHPARGANMQLEQTLAVTAAKPVEFAVTVTDQASSPSVELVSTYINVEKEDSVTTKSGTFELGLRTKFSEKKVMQSWEWNNAESELNSITTLQWSAEETLTFVVTNTNDVRREDNVAKYNIDSSLTVPSQDVTFNFHMHHHTVGDTVQFSEVLSKNGEEKFFYQWDLMYESGVRNGYEYTLQMRNPHNYYAPDIEMTLRSWEMENSYEYFLSQRTRADQKPTVVTLGYEKTSNETDDTDTMTLTILWPVVVYQNTIFCTRSKAAPYTHAGLFFIVNPNEESESKYGLETYITGDSAENFYVGIFTTAPYHSNSITYNLKFMPEVSFSSNLDIMYMKGQHLMFNTMLTRDEANPKAFDFELAITAPFKSVRVMLNHWQDDTSFNPHLIVAMSAFKIRDIKLLDFEIDFTKEETIFGQNDNLIITTQVMKKIVTLDTGVVRNANGLNYHFVIRNPDEERLRINIGTAVFVQDVFNTDITISVSSVYAPSYPVDILIHFDYAMGQIGMVSSLNVTRAPVVTFQINKRSDFEVVVPEPARRTSLSAVLYLPRNSNPNHRTFALETYRDTTEDERVVASTSFRWGEEKQIVASVSSAMQDGSTQVSLSLKQPFEIAGLEPEYIGNVTFYTSDSGFRWNFTNNFGSMQIDHFLEGGTPELPHYATSVQLHKTDCTPVRLISLFEKKSETAIKEKVVFMYSDSKDEELTINIDSNTDMTEDGMEVVVELGITHPVSEIDFETLWSIENNVARAYFGLEGVLHGEHDPIPIAFEGEVNKGTKSFFLHSNGPLDEMWVRGNVDDSHNEEGVYRVDMHTELNGEVHPYNFEVDMMQKSLTFAVEKETGDVVLGIGYLNDSAIEVKLAKTTRNSEVQHAKATLSLLDPHTFYLLLNWRPEYPLELQEDMEPIKEWISSMASARQAFVANFVMQAEERISSFMETAITSNAVTLSKIIAIQDGVVVKMEELRPEFEAEKQAMMARFVAFAEEVKTEFAGLRDEYRDLSSGASNNYEQLLVGDQVRNYFQAARTSLENYIASTVAELYLYQQEMNEEMAVAGVVYAQMMEEQQIMVSNQVENYKNALMEEMRDNWVEAQENLMTRWEDFIFVMAALADTDEVERMKLSFYSNRILRDAISLRATAMARRRELYDWYVELFNRKAAVDRNMRSDGTILRNIRNHFSLVTSAPSIQMAGDHTWDLIDSTLTEQISNKIEDKAQQFLDWIIELERGYKYLADIENGQIEFWFYTQERYDNLVTPPRTDSLSYLKSAISRLGEDFPLATIITSPRKSAYDSMPLVRSYFEENYGLQPDLWDLWELRAAINKRIYRALRVPSFKGQAIMAGNQHFKTFDGEYFAFAGKCSFLLAHDFVNRSFSVLVDYERKENMDRTMVVILGHTTIELSSDGKVTVNRKIKELPYGSDDGTEITRMGTSITVSSGRGLKLSCCMQSNICVLELSKWYFGKTAGLFGNFNYEPSDDFTTSAGEVVEDVDEFTRSWEVGKRCETHLNKAVTCDASTSLGKNAMCAATFFDGTASQCHSMVTPEPFYTMCVNLGCQVESYEDNIAGTCEAFAAYALTCATEGVDLSMPSYCYDCRSVESSFNLGGSYIIEEPVMSADIVLVIEQKSCMSEKVDALNDLVQTIDEELTRNGYRDNKFGLVGFGGAGVNEEARSHTLNGQIMGERVRVIVGLNAFEFSEEGEGNAKDAVTTASYYPFRAAVAKHIILVSCSGSHNSMRSFNKVQKMLKNDGIKLSVLMSYEFSLNVGDGVKEKNDRVLGIDSRGAYTNKLAGQDPLSVKGDKGLLQYVTKPNIPMALAAMETGGSIFDSSLLDEKAFEDVFALWMIRNSEVLTGPLTCQCTRGEYGYAKNVCSPMEMEVTDYASVFY